ncbi:hypothetical protein AWENTII_009542 [Aspergillus wentii]
MGWSGTDESGNFTHKRLASEAGMGGKILGDVVVVRSSPTDLNYSEIFSKPELVKALDFYKTANPVRVFSERERAGLWGRWAFHRK